MDKKVYDLEERTEKFARKALDFIGKIPKTIITIEIMKQLVRSSTSVGANYIEANECLGKKDFFMRIKICKKEAKETIFWLKLLEFNDNALNQEREYLKNEATELMKIFGSIAAKARNPNL